MDIDSFIYLGYAIIQLPDLLVSFYRRFATNSNELEVNPKSFGTKEFKRISKTSNTTEKYGMILGSPNIVPYPAKTDPEIQNKRIEKLEYEMALLLKNLKK